MKEVKVFTISNLLISILKMLGGFLGNSFTMVASGLYDLELWISSLFLFFNKKSNTIKGIITSLWGLIILLLGLGIIFISEVLPIKVVSFWIMLFLVISVLIRYFVPCFYTNINYRKKKGVLSQGIINSSVDFYNYGIIFVTLVLSKLSGYFDILKYVDRLGTILVSILIVIRGIKIIRNSFKVLENNITDDMNEQVKEEINKRDEVDAVKNIKLSNYGGLIKVDCSLRLKNNVSLLDLNTFVITLQDYLLKIFKGNVVQINLVDNVKKKVKVRSMKQDARNSRGRNSKANVKKKNSKQKNKKR